MYLSELLSFFFLLTIFFCYLFLDPQGYVKTQKLLHTLRVELYGAGSGIRTHVALDGALRGRFFI